jgi:hypothetical protein
MKALALGKRMDVVVGLAVVAASVVTAIVIHHRPVSKCSYPWRGPPPPGCISWDYSMTLRVGIVVAGLIVAGFIITIGTYTRRRWG